MRFLDIDIIFGATIFHNQGLANCAICSSLHALVLQFACKQVRYFWKVRAKANRYSAIITLGYQTNPIKLSLGDKAKARPNNHHAIVSVLYSLKPVGKVPFAYCDCSTVPDVPNVPDEDFGGPSIAVEAGECHVW